MTKIFKIGAYELPILSALEIDQAYEPIGGDDILRSISGRGVKQETWQKLKVTTSGSGWIPAGLSEVNTRIQQQVACITPRLVSAAFATRQATLPAARRTDIGHLPYGLALFADGQALMSAVSMAGNVGTVAAVAGAIAYKIGYYPLLTCWVRRPKESGPSPKWEIVAEEV